MNSVDLLAKYFIETGDWLPYSSDIPAVLEFLRRYIHWLESRDVQSQLRIEELVDEVENLKSEIIEASEGHI